MVFDSGTDLPPTGGVPLAQENVPKSMARVLQAEGVRKTFREKRVRLDEGGEDERQSKRRKKDGEAQKPAGIKVCYSPLTSSIPLPFMHIWV